MTTLVLVCSNSSGQIRLIAKTIMRKWLTHLKAKLRHAFQRSCTVCVFKVMTLSTKVISLKTQQHACSKLKLKTRVAMSLYSSQFSGRRRCGGRRHRVRNDGRRVSKCPLLALFHRTAQVEISKKLGHSNFKTLFIKLNVFSC